MSEPAMFVLIRDGKKSFYGDRWANVFLYRELMWGPEDFEKWVTQLEPLDDDGGDVSGGAVVDFDQRKLSWTGDNDHLKIPKVEAVYNRLLQVAWPRYEIHCDPHSRFFGNFPDPAESEEGDYYEYDVVENALMYAPDPSDEEEEEEDQEEGEMEDSDQRAWVTVIDSAGAIHHRHLQGLPKDLLTNAPGVVQRLAGLNAADVPREEVVIQGMWIDEPRRTIGLWGGSDTRNKLERLTQHWQGWNVRWAERGYAEHCQVSGPGGTPMTETAALAKFLPIVLSTKRFDMGTMMGFFGGQLKRTAMKATGCLLIAMCFPVLLFGLISGNWRASLITCAVVCVIVIAAFKLIEMRFKRSMSAKMKPLQRGSEDDERAPVAGPLDKEVRRQRIDQLLLAAGFPPLKQIEPSFRKDDAMEMLGG